MNILQVNCPGFQPIPPNNWGAIEKIIWEYSLGMKKLGHSVDIKKIEEVDDFEIYDIVHCHVYDTALELAKRKVPYVFTFHDHNIYLMGKDNDIYELHKKAMNGSVLSIVPANYLVDFFDGIPKFLEHGVDSVKYCPAKEILNQRKDIICVGNNGLCGDDPNNVYDRKGFLPAIDIARELNLAITIAGPSNINKTFFEQNPEYAAYEKLRILYDLSDEELIKEYQRHTVMLHLTSIEAGNPPLTVLEGLSCGLVTISTNCGEVIHLNNVQSKEEALSILKTNVLDNFSAINQNESIKKKYDWPIIVGKLMGYYYEIINSKNLFLSNKIEELYEASRLKDIEQNSHNYELPRADVKFSPNPHIVLHSGFEGEVEFINDESKEVIYRSNLSPGLFASCSISYYVPWRIRLINNKNEYNYKLSLKNKRVLINFESSSLGDTLAWMPYAEEFQKKHDCELHVFSFWNEIFRGQYDNLTLTDFNNKDDFYAVYNLGVYYNEDDTLDTNKHKTDFKQQNLQKNACDIMGLEYKPKRPKVVKTGAHFKKNKVIISPYSTAKAKLWNSKEGWQDVINFLNNRGYEVTLISKETSQNDLWKLGQKEPFKNVIYKEGDLNIKDRIKDMEESCLFIGLGSGLSWLAWSVGIPVVMISGFSEKYTEFDCFRVINEKTCHGCFNHHRLNPGKWDWCPNNKNFECSEKISSKRVIKYIKKALKI